MTTKAKNQSAKRFEDQYNSTNPIPKGLPDAEYVYQTAEGHYAFEIHRWGTGDDKAFRVLHIVKPGNVGPGETQEQSGFGPTGPLLFRLPQLTAASKDTLVWLCEGEKDAETVAALGEIATTNPNGAKHWTEDYSKALTGRVIVVVEDNDDAGRARTKKILQSLRKYAAGVSVVRFEDQPDKSDVTDFLRAGHTLDELKLRMKPAAADFERNEKGVPYPSQRNVRLALEHLGVTVRHDEFKDCLMIDGLDKFGPELNDPALIRLRLMADDRFHLRVSKELFGDIVADAARQSNFHPIRDYLDGLVWDGIPRLDGWLCAYGGAEETKYVRAIGSITLIAAVRRVRQPGCKFDEMLILESEQGKDKSSALAVLAKKAEWFSDDLPLNQDSQRVIERMAGHWIIEAAELNGMRKGDVEHLKSFMSRQFDRARLAYGRLPITVPRQCVIIGTDNSSLYLRDGTGNRRFWPVKIEQFDLVALRRDVDQLWAEAALREAAGESIRLDPKLWNAAAEQQDQRRVDDPFVDLLRDALKGMDGKIRTLDIWAGLGIVPAQRTTDLSTRLGAAMRQLGWKPTRLRFGGEPEYCFKRGSGTRQIKTSGVGKASYVDGPEPDEAPM